MKKCSKCKISKPLTCFSNRAASKDKHYHTCKPCKSIADKEYREANKEKLRLQSIDYRRKNKVAIAKTNKLRYDSATPDEVVLRASLKKERNAKAPEEVKQRKRDYDKKYFASSAGRKVIALSAKRRRAQKLSTEDGTITHQSLALLMDSQDGKCSYCGTLLDLQPKGDTHLDHVIPLSKGGVHSITNVVWSCAPCNHKKSDRLL